MSFQTPITIYEATENIKEGKYLLPAIQREFTWQSNKIEWLFDSLMRGYPISSFLFWNVEGESGYKFYDFLTNYRERYNIHNADANVEGTDNFTAILDGQQRLTSLHIGLRGSFAYKEKGRHWNNDEWSIPTRRLYLNLTKKLDDQEEEDGRVYEFSFLADSITNREDITDDSWFRVGKILELKNFSTFNRYVTEKELDNLAADILARLQEVIFTERSINYFLEKEQDLHKALNIFIRINSGGQPLNFSDLIMSIAIANWKTKDARKEIHALVDRVQDIGFSISKDLIFKTYLYLYSSDIRFKVTNFTTENAENFEEDWENIRDAIQKTFELVRSFGYNDFTLTSKNAVIPIIYYLYHQNIYKGFKERTKHKSDREIIKKWLHVMTIKRIFGGQSDGTLSQIRKAFTEDITKGDKMYTGIALFPTEAINGKIKRDTSVGGEFIEDLLITQKDDRYAFPLLALLFPNMDYVNNEFHKDHLHPISSFDPKKLDLNEIQESNHKYYSSKEWNNSIINLQMLDSNENMSKQDKPLKEWIEDEPEIRNTAAFRARCLIPEQVSLEFLNFGEFAEKRKELISTKLKELLK